MKSHPFYLLVKVTSWIGLKLFFGGVKLIDKQKIPKEGAIILAPNHQGAFMDAMLVGTYTGRPVHFLTRADIFKKGWVISILRSLHMMPIYRIRDGIQSLSGNDEVFESCFQLLREGKAVLIFPEGNHGFEYYLRPISKGSARLALDAREALEPAIPLYVVPVGINYFSHKWPFAKVKMKFGDAIDTSAYRELYQEHKQKAYNKFKEDLATGMKNTLILADHSEDYETRRDFIFQPKHEHLSFDELKKMGDAPATEARPIPKTGMVARAFIAFFSLFNIVPLMGLSRFLPIFKDPVFQVSIKYLAGSLFHILWWSLWFAISTIWVSWMFGLLLVAVLVLMAFGRQSLKSY